jgi:hypothetical protein
MVVRLTPEQEAMIRRAEQNGRSPEAIVAEALALWEENERKLAELRALIAEADNNPEPDSEYDEESIKTLADELIREARALRDAGQL